MRTAAKLLLISTALILSGCASRTIEAASTRLRVGSAMGRTVDVILPKNVQAKNLTLTVNPTTGEYSLHADELSADASPVIESAGVAQANAISKMADAVSIVAQLAKGTVAP